MVEVYGRAGGRGCNRDRSGDRLESRISGRQACIHRLIRRTFAQPDARRALANPNPKSKSEPEPGSDAESERAPLTAAESELLGALGRSDQVAGVGEGVRQGALEGLTLTVSTSNHAIDRGPGPALH